MMGPSRKRAYQKGIWAERIAAIFLLAKGYRILTMRYKSKMGEVDIIAKRGQLVIAVEVKARQSIDEAVFAVTHETAKRVESAAGYWLSQQRNASELSLRFDIIAISPWRWPLHLVDAF